MVACGIMKQERFGQGSGGLWGKKEMEDLGPISEAGHVDYYRLYAGREEKGRIGEESQVFGWSHGLVEFQ